MSVLTGWFSTTTYEDGPHQDEYMAGVGEGREHK